MAVLRLCGSASFVRVRSPVSQRGTPHLRLPDDRTVPQPFPETYGRRRELGPQLEEAPCS